MSATTTKAGKRLCSRNGFLRQTPSTLGQEVKIDVDRLDSFSDLKPRAAGLDRKSYQLKLAATHSTGARYLAFAKIGGNHPFIMQQVFRLAFQTQFTGFEHVAVVGRL